LRRAANGLPRGEIGQIFARTTTQFEAYTSGQTKDFEDGFMASGDMGYLDDDGRLFVVGRDDEMVVSGGKTRQLQGAPRHRVPRRVASQRRRQGPPQGAPSAHRRYVKG